MKYFLIAVGAGVAGMIVYGVGSRMLGGSTDSEPERTKIELTWEQKRIDELEAQLAQKRQNEASLKAILERMEAQLSRMEAEQNKPKDELKRAQEEVQKEKNLLAEKWVELGAKTTELEEAKKKFAEESEKFLQEAKEKEEELSRKIEAEVKKVERKREASLLQLQKSFEAKLQEKTRELDSLSASRSPRQAKEVRKKSLAAEIEAIRKRQERAAENIQKVHDAAIEEWRKLTITKPNANVVFR